MGMKKLFIFFLILIINSSVNAKEVNLACELSKFFTKKYMMEDLKQVPLSKLEPTNLKKVTLALAMDNKKFLGSN